MHIGNTNTAGALGGIYLVTSDSAGTINILSEDSVAGVGADIVDDIAVNQNIVLVHNTDSSVHLVAELAAINLVERRTVIGCSTTIADTYIATIELAVGDENGIGTVGLKQCILSRSNSTTVDELTVFKDAVSTLGAKQG